MYKYLILKLLKLRYYFALIKKPAIDDKMDFDTAKILICEYKKVKGEDISK